MSSAACCKEIAFACASCLVCGAATDNQQSADGAEGQYSFMVAGVRFASAASQKSSKKSISSVTPEC
jgi:hypothetical protein